MRSTAAMWRAPPASAAVAAVPPSPPAAQLRAPLAARCFPRQAPADVTAAPQAPHSTLRHRSRRRRGGGGAATCAALPPLLPTLEEPEESYVRLDAPEGGAEIHLFGVIHGGNESEVAEFIVRERPEVGGLAGCS